MIQQNPELVKATSEVAPRGVESYNTSGSMSNRSSVVAAISDSPDGSSIHAPSEADSASVVPDSAFIFVPPDPKFYYKRLYEIALDHDYDAMKDLPPDEDVSLTILSAVNEELLGDCAKRWRIMGPLRAGTFLNLISQHYKHQGVPEACVAEALNGLARVDEVWPYWRWPWLDVSLLIALKSCSLTSLAQRQYLFKTLSALFDILLTRFFEIFQGLLDLPFDEILHLLETVHSNEIFREDVRDLSIILDELQEGMRKFVGFAYEEKQADVDSLPRPHDLYPFLVMLDWIKAEAKGYNKQFPQPVAQ